MGPFLNQAYKYQHQLIRTLLYIKNFPNISDISLHMGVRIGGWDVQLFPTPNIKNKIVQGEGIQI